MLVGYHFIAHTLHATDSSFRVHIYKILKESKYNLKKEKWPPPRYVHKMTSKGQTRNKITSVLCAFVSKEEGLYNWK